MTPRRLLFPAALAAALLLGLAARLVPREAHTAGGRTRSFGSDDDYHLRRARFAVAHFPRTILFDPLMNFPEGGVPIWPPLFDLALAAPTRALHGPGAAPAVIEREAAWVPLAFAAAAILLAGLLGREVAGSAGGAATALFVAVCPAHILWSQFAHTDQHAAESATGLLVLFAFVASRRETAAGSSEQFAGDREIAGKRTRSPVRRPRIRWELATGLALAIAVLTWQGAIYWGAVIALSLILESVFLRRCNLGSALRLLAAPAVLTAAATAAWLGDLRPPVTYVSFGFFQPLFLGALAAGTVFLETLLRAARGDLARRELFVRAILLLIAGALLLGSGNELARGLAGGVGYVLGRTTEETGAGGYVSYPRDWLKGIFEAQPLLAGGPGLPVKQLSAAFFAAPVVIVLWALRVRRGPLPATHLILVVWGLVTLLLALSQRLNVYYAAPLAGLALVETVRLCRRAAGGSGGRKVPRRDSRRLSSRLESESAGGARGRATLGAGALGLLLLLPMARGLRDELSTVRLPGSDLYATLEWMRVRLPRAVDAYDPRLLERIPPPGLDRASSVLAPWSLGHLILYNAEQPVVANNFGYGFLESIRFFLAETEEEALAIATRRRVRWVLATDLVPRMNDYARYLGKPPYLGQSPGGPMPTPAYFRTLQSRLYDFDGLGAAAPGIAAPPLSRFRLIHRSASAIPRGGRWVARWKVFEVTPRADALGATARASPFARAGRPQVEEKVPGRPSAPPAQ